MSLFKAERPSVNRVHFEPTVLPTPGNVSGGTSAGPGPGDIWFDAGTQTFQGVTGFGQVGLSSVQASPLLLANAVVNTNPLTAPVALATYLFPAGQLNAVGKAFFVYAAGEYASGTGTSTITLVMTLGDGTNTRTLLTWTSGATTANVTANPWNADGRFVIQASGSSGTALAHGTAKITLGAAGATTATSYNDVNAAVSSALDLTKAITLTVGQYFSATNATQTFTQDMLIVESLN